MELTLEEAALAWAQKKRVEARPVKGGCWKPIDEIGECDAEKFSQSVFGFRDDFEFRLAPEPPAKKFRPWEIHEVPVGATIHPSGSSFMALIVEAEIRDGDLWIHGSNSRQWHAIGMSQDENLKWSSDGGKTLFRCGVEVDA